MQVVLVQTAQWDYEQTNLLYNIKLLIYKKKKQIRNKIEIEIENNK